MGKSVDKDMHKGKRALEKRLEDWESVRGETTLGPVHTAKMKSVFHLL